MIAGVALNEPFAGTYVPLAFYGTDARVTSILIELRRDIDVGDSIAIEELGGGLAALVNAVHA